MVLIFACKTRAKAPISGNIKLAEGWKPKVYLILPRHFNELATGYQGVVADSASIDEQGNFAFPKFKPKAAQTLIQLCVQTLDQRFPNQLNDADPVKSNYMPLLVEAQYPILLTADIEQLQASIRLKNPSPENQALLDLRDVRHRAFQSEQVYLGPGQTSDEYHLLEREAALLRYQKQLMDFADSVSFFWPSMLALKWVSPVGDYEHIPEFMVSQCEKWRDKSIENQWIVSICQPEARAKLPVLTGDPMPDFDLPMAGGDTLKLRSLLGKKITILDVWASWCAPCRHENREVLVPLWKQFKDQGLEIIGYAIDASPVAWRTAIEKDGAFWPQSSHLSGDETPFLQVLRITTIPANYVLDAHGVVIAKNLHGEALNNFIREHLK